MSGYISYVECDIIPGDKLGRGVRVRNSDMKGTGRGPMSSKDREAQLSESLMSKDKELRDLKRDFETLKSTHKILTKDSEETNSELESLQLNYEKLTRDFGLYKKSVQERESVEDKGIVRRFIGWPLRFGQSILSRETIRREEKIKERGVLIANLNENISKLKKKVSEQRRDIVERTQGEKKWKKRYDALSAEKRSESGLERDSLVDRLRERLDVERRKNMLLEEEVSRLKKEGHSKGDELDSVHAAVKKANDEFDIIEIMDSGWKSAKKSPFMNANLVYETLEVMANEASLWVEKPDGSGSFEDDIKIYVDVAENDSQDRYWKVGNINQKMNRHVKLGVDRDPSKTLRIYYDITRKGRLRIGWCGEHP